MHVTFKIFYMHQKMYRILKEGEINAAGWWMCLDSSLITHRHPMDDYFVLECLVSVPLSID